MTAPDEIQRWTADEITPGFLWKAGDGDWVAFADHQSALADRDREIERLKAELAAANEAVTIRQAALEQRTAENDRLQEQVRTLQTGQTYRYIGKDGKVVLARDLEDQRDRLQARLKACPTVEQLREWALSLPKGGYRRSAEQMTETANRMAALNDK